MSALLQDIRYGFRQLARQSGFSIVAVITLSLGIGMSTAIFSVIDAAMLRPLPYPHPQQLVSVGVEETQSDGRIVRPTASMSDIRHWQASGDVFSSVAGWGRAFLGRPPVHFGGRDPQRPEYRRVCTENRRQDARPGKMRCALEHMHEKFRFLCGLRESLRGSVSGG